MLGDPNEAVGSAFKPRNLWKTNLGTRTWSCLDLNFMKSKFYYFSEHYFVVAPNEDVESPFKSRNPWKTYLGTMTAMLDCFCKSRDLWKPMENVLVASNEDVESPYEPSKP